LAKCSNLAHRRIPLYLSSTAKGKEKENEDEKGKEIEREINDGKGKDTSKEDEEMKEQEREAGKEGEREGEEVELRILSEHLTALDLSYTAIDDKLLKAVLAEAPLLRELKLDGCGNLLSPSIHADKLTGLSISKCTNMVLGSSNNASTPTTDSTSTTTNNNNGVLLLSPPLLKRSRSNSAAASNGRKISRYLSDDFTLNRMQPIRSDSSDDGWSGSGESSDDDSSTSGGSSGITVRRRKVTFRKDDHPDSVLETFHSYSPDAIPFDIVAPRLTQLNLSGTTHPLIPPLPPSF